MKFVRNLCLTLLGFLVAVLARTALLPRLPGPTETEISGVLAQRQSCTVLFFGPSYMRQLDPPTFDSEAQSIGLDAKACRFAMGGLRGYELRLWLDRILSHDWPKLELVVIDMTLGYDIQFEPENWLKRRTIEWHIWDSLPWLSDYYESKRRPGKSWNGWLMTRHLEHVAAHYLAVGEGTEALRELHLLEPKRQIPEAVAREIRRLGRKAKPQRRGKAYERSIEHLVEKKKKTRPADSAWPLELRELVRSHGKEAYFLIAPVLNVRSVPKRALGGRDPLVVLDFNDPSRFPELYVESVRGRTSHLNGHGDVIYSKLIAQGLHRIERGSR